MADLGVERLGAEPELHRPAARGRVGQQQVRRVPAQEVREDLGAEVPPACS